MAVQPAPAPKPIVPAPPDAAASAKRVVHGAALALLGFSVFTAIALAAWFHRAAEPWSWKSVLALVCAALGLTTSALVWRAPSRTHVLAGIGVVLVSLVRLGAPSGWTFASFALLGLTALLLLPLVRAARLLWKR